MEEQCKHELDQLIRYFKEEIERIWSRLDKGDQTFAELRKAERKHAETNIDMKKDIQYLIKQMQSLVKAIWAVILLWLSLSIGFILWYIQTGG